MNERVPPAKDHLTRDINPRTADLTDYLKKVQESSRKTKKIPKKPRKPKKSVKRHPGPVMSHPHPQSCIIIEPTSH